MVDTLTAIESAGLTELMNLFDILVREVVVRPHKEALIFEGQRHSYKDVLSRATAIALQLSQAGVRKGMRVAILFPNHPDYVAAFFAVTGIGGIVVPVNPLLKSEEIGHILSDSGAVVLIVHESALEEALKSKHLAPSLNKILVSRTQEKGPSGSPVVVLDTSSPGQEVKKLDLTVDPGDCSVVGPAEVPVETLVTGSCDASLFPTESTIDREKDLALLVYTSGTTGKPKGAMLTHGNILAVFPRRLSMLDIGPGDRTLAVLPMCHIYGITVVMIGALSTGGSLAMLTRFDPVAALQLIERERVTIVPAVPAMHRFMLMEMEKNTYDVSSVRLCLSGGSSLPQDLHREIESSMGAACLEGYALTETACATTINPLHGKRKPGSVGPAMDGIAVRICGANGQPLASGLEHVGEVQVKGANVMSGYYNQPDSSREVLTADGWFCTGDLGYKDEDGYLYIVGRKKEMIIRGGQNIYPREIEDVLCRMPGIVEAAVVGVPDKYMGERVKAVLVTNLPERPDEEVVRAFCAEHLAEYKVPRIVEFRETLPRNSTGKILKRLL